MVLPNLAPGGKEGVHYGTMGGGEKREEWQEDANLGKAARCENENSRQPNDH